MASAWTVLDGTAGSDWVHTGRITSPAGRGRLYQGINSISSSMVTIEPGAVMSLKLSGSPA
jgi:hypothetical protein